MQLADVVNPIIVLLADPAPSGGKSIPDQLGVNLGGLLFQAAGFGILLFVLWRFAYGPLLRIIDERRERAQEIVDKSDQIKRDLSDTQARNKAEMDKARTEAQAIINEARTTKDRIVNEAVEKARAEASAEIQKARTEITAEREQAIAQLRHETADLAIIAATRVIGRELTVNKDLQSQLINDVLANASTGNGAGKATASNNGDQTQVIRAIPRNN